ncbi:acyltransferase family protein [Hymenobacter glacialis]|uniref:Acyltransferase 3 domain-containing protein n=1 Tax=Hymenobacter glacialis TaxID=1908236 RepID=A0A1G1SZY2_9BACT|nr:acyltransferase [Hymenobacter glacialis]OGX84178.1 hypothetical protein BEN48_16420 [Hymenobacter glacialis]
MSKTVVKRDLVLDALRGIAAVLVVLFHLTMDTGNPDYGLHLGMTGVDLFFLISGFVIFMTLRKTSSSKDFVISRLIRLYPTYWACVSFTFAINVLYAVTHNSLSLNYIGQYLANMTMFQHYLGVENLDHPYWTMIVEMVFYLSMLIIYRTGQIKNIEWIGGILSAVCFLISTVGRSFFYEAYEVVNFVYPLLNHFPLFFAGIVFYLIKYDRPSVARYVMIGGCFVCSLFVFDNLGRGAYLTYSEHVATLVVYFSLMLLYINNKLSWVSNKVFVYLGTISYALYLIHQNISVFYLRPLMARVLPGKTGFWLGNIVILVTVIGLASAVTYWIEKPAMKLLKAKLQPRKPTAYDEKTIA